MLGFDASRYQSADAVKARLADPAIGFGIINATKGIDYVSAGLAIHAPNVRASGKCAGWYHWLLFEGVDPKAQAAHFVATVKALVGEALAADIEQTSKRLKADGTFEYVIPENALPVTLDFLRETTRLARAKPYAYLNLWWLDTFFRRATTEQWAELTSYPLWLAHYTGVPGQFGNTTWGTHGWKVSIHQFTNKDSAGMDGNWFAGGPSIWRSLGVPA